MRLKIAKQNYGLTFLEPSEMDKRFGKGCKGFMEVDTGVPKRADRRNIYIRNGMSGQMTILTFWHEIYHAMQLEIETFQRVSGKREELEADAFAYFIYHFIKDNAETIKKELQD